MMGEGSPPVEEFGWLHFGTPGLAPLQNQCVSLLHCSKDGYRMPRVFEAIARDREGPGKEGIAVRCGGHLLHGLEDFFHAPELFR